MKLFHKEFMKEESFPFWIEHKFHTKENIPPLHVHNFIELVYVVSGEADHIFENEIYTVSTGDIFIINPGEAHTYQLKNDEQLEIVNCLFLSKLIEDIWLQEIEFTEMMDFFYIHPFLHNNERFYHSLNLVETEAEEVHSQLKRMIEEFNSKKLGHTTFIRFQLIQLLIQLSRAYSKSIEPVKKESTTERERKVLIQRIKGHLERHYDQKLTLESLANRFAISSRHLNRIFKQETGETVIEAIHQIRIRRARDLLSQTTEKIITIAIEIGYDDPAFFTKLFTRAVGCSPGEYRRLCHPENYIRKDVKKDIEIQSNSIHKLG